MSKPKNQITYFRRGRVERGQGFPIRYRWCEGYSANGQSGAPLFPWMTRRECQRDAKAQGAVAAFVDQGIQSAAKESIG